MKARALAVGILLGATLQFIGCGSTDTISATASPEIAGSRMSRQARKAGCRTICNKCSPGVPCVRRCTIVCPGDVVSCGDTACQNGEVCCNESCGICTPPDAVCAQQVCKPSRVCVQNALCIRGFHWSPRKCMCIPDVQTPPCVDTILCIRGSHWSSDQCTCVPDAPGQCTNDADCRLFSDYCTGCDCRALATSDADPTCDGPGVRCFADPCLNRAAMCVNGRCAVTAANPPPAPTAVGPRRPRPPRAPHAPRRPHQPGTPQG